MYAMIAWPTLKFPSMISMFKFSFICLKAQDAAAAGDTACARKRAKISLILNIFSIIVYIITLVIYAVILAVVFTSVVGHRRCSHISCDVLGCVYVYYNC